MSTAMSAASLPYPCEWTASQLLSELQSSLSATAAVERELSELSASRAGLERQLAQASPHIADAVADVMRAHSGAGRVVSASHASAQALSSKVRELDEVAANVSAALARVESVLALRQTIARVRERLATGQVALAADDLWRALFVGAPIENDLSFHLLLDLEKRLREEAAREAIERTVRQARTEVLESKEVMKLARVWPKVGYGYRGLVLHCAQVRHECLALIHRSGWSLQHQHERAVIDYARNVGSIIDTVNEFIIHHLLLVQSVFGNGAQIRLVQELVTNVVDVEVATKLLTRFIEERKIKDAKGGANTNVQSEDVVARIKQVNARVAASATAAANGHAGHTIVTYYHSRDASTQMGSPLHIQSLDELLDEIKFLAYDVERFLKGIDQLARQSLDFLGEAVTQEKEQRDQMAKKNNTSDADRKKQEDLFQRFLSTPNDLAALPSVHAQHGRVMTVLQRLMQDDKHQRNVLDITITDDRHTFASAPPLPAEGPIPAALLQLPASSPFLIGGFGLDPHIATSSRLYDVQLTIISRYVLIEEYYMNYNVEKAIAIDEHDALTHSGADEAANAGCNNSGSTSHHDDLESELEAADVRKERERAAASGGGLHSLASAISSSNSGIDPYLYLTGVGGAANGVGLPKSFLSSFSSHRTSTIVDNACFIYKKCLQRALKTTNRDAVYSILLRVHENFDRKLRRVFEIGVARYEAQYGSKKKTSLSYALFQNPTAYLLPAASGARSNLLGAWASAATGAGGSPGASDLRNKSQADIALILTVNNLDSTIENMQSLTKYLDHAIDELYDAGDDADPSQPRAGSTVVTHYTRGLSLDQMKEKLAEFHSTFRVCDQLIGRGLQCIADACWLRLLPRLSLLQTHANELYAQSDLLSSSADLSDQIVSSYIDVFKRDILSLESALNENNFYQLVFKVMQLSARHLEQMLLPKTTSSRASHATAADSHAARPLQFTQSGGLQFDKQVRTLTSFFTNDVAAHLERHFADNFFLYLHPSATGGANNGLVDAASEAPQWRVSFSGSAQARQIFSRLAHVASILSVDKPAEVLEYTERELFNLKKDEVRTHAHAHVTPRLHPILSSLSLTLVCSLLPLSSLPGSAHPQLAQGVLGERDQRTQAVNWCTFDAHTVTTFKDSHVHTHHHGHTRDRRAPHALAQGRARIDPDERWRWSKIK